MQVIEKNPHTYEAVQFNKEGDFPGIKRGYIQTHGAHQLNSHQAVYISEAMPRSMDCKFCYVLEIGIVRTPVYLGDWILSEINNDSGKRKVVNNKKFLKKYLAIKVKASDVNRTPDIDQLK